jgi:hypothetical protein
MYCGLWKVETSLRVGSGTNAHLLLQEEERKANVVLPWQHDGTQKEDMACTTGQEPVIHYVRDSDNDYDSDEDPDDDLDI